MWPVLSSAISMLTLSALPVAPTPTVPLKAARPVPVLLETRPVVPTTFPPSPPVPPAPTTTTTPPTPPRPTPTTTTTTTCLRMSVPSTPAADTPASPVAARTPPLRPHPPRVRVVALATPPAQAETALAARTPALPVNTVAAHPLAVAVQPVPLFSRSLRPTLAPPMPPLPQLAPSPRVRCSSGQNGHRGRCHCSRQGYEGAQSQG